MMAAFQMNEKTNMHIPVLLNEAVDALITSADGLYVDATFGRGSHSRAILDRLNENGRLIAFDKDLEAVAYAQQLAAKDSRFTIVHGSFTQLQTYLAAKDLVGKVTGVLFDLGVSSPQLDSPERGFSFIREGALDMRMDTSRGVSAQEWLATIGEEALANVIWQYGEEKFSRRIAKAIVTKRQETPITTTTQLAHIVKFAVPAPKKGQYDKHPATRSFQAIRIAVNEELTELEQVLDQALTVLTMGGYLCAISFHSLEDRIVKQFIRRHEKADESLLPRGLPIKGSTFKARLKSIGKPVKPSLQEIENNPRARSAILRIAEKIS